MISPRFRISVSLKHVIAGVPGLTTTGGCGASCQSQWPDPMRNATRKARVTAIAKNSICFGVIRFCPFETRLIGFESVGCGRATYCRLACSTRSASRALVRRRVAVRVRTPLGARPAVLERADQVLLRFDEVDLHGRSLLPVPVSLV